ncbi:hypothetical protein Q1695_010858 [Nippostrongylus brasiliensis]|nr:hypothetical protein Q1695_010858 [Nippostrongylus brasiliensis]
MVTTASSRLGVEKEQPGSSFSPGDAQCHHSHPTPALSLTQSRNIQNECRLFFVAILSHILPDQSIILASEAPEEPIVMHIVDSAGESADVRRQL